ncbi:MAG: hypothetical protein IJB17_04760, partial [Oscillospiraceae bacterium]|nr:hypothetical protein [Oscillospiraceae bacterium]
GLSEPRPESPQRLVSEADRGDTSSSLHSSLGNTAKKTLKINGLFRIEALQSPSQKSNRFLTAPFTQGGLWVRCKHVNKSEFVSGTGFGVVAGFC